MIPRDRHGISGYFEKLGQNAANIKRFDVVWAQFSKLPPGEYEPSQLAAMLNRIARSHEQAPKSFPQDFMSDFSQKLAPWYASALAVMGDATAVSLESMLRSFSSFRILPPPHFMQGWSETARKKLPDETGYIPYASYGLAHAKLGLMPEPAFEAAWLDGINTYKSTMHENLLANILWSLAVLDVMAPAPRYRETAQNLVSELGKPDISAANIPVKVQHQIEHACLWFDLPSPAPAPYGRQEFDKVGFEGEMTTAFRKAGIPLLEKAAWLPILDKSVDLAIGTAHGTVFLEADGPRHFVIHPDGEFRYNGSTRLQSALTAKLYPDTPLLRISDRTLARLRSRYRGGWPQRLAKLFEAAATPQKTHKKVPQVIALQDGRLYLRTLMRTKPLAL